MEPSSLPTPPTDRDGLLTAWVVIANKGTTETSVTLQVAGLIVTGDLIGVGTYYKALGEQFAAGTADGEAQQGWKATFDELAQSSTAVAASSAEDLSTLPQYIHLRNARILRADGELIPHNSGVLWRGRLTAVDAWWFGLLSFERRKAS